jgi:dipeptidase E
MECILTSYIDLYDKDSVGNRIAKNFGNDNKILDNIKKYVKKYDNFLFVASNEFDNEVTDVYANLTFESFNMTLPFKNYYILDSRTEDIADELIQKADLIFLCGGHVPTQNKFFSNIDLKEKIKNADALIIGVSAGAMNMASIVYCPPELEGEAADPNFNRFYEGLGLTNINVFPHYDELKDDLVDGIHVINEIVIPDSFKYDIYAINNGSYILIDDKNYLYGEAYLIKDGKIEKINENDELIVF